MDDPYSYPFNRRMDDPYCDLCKLIFDYLDYPHHDVFMIPNLIFLGMSGMIHIVISVNKEWMILIVISAKSGCTLLWFK